MQIFREVYYILTYYVVFPWAVVGFLAGVILSLVCFLGGRNAWKKYGKWVFMCFLGAILLIANAFVETATGTHGAILPYWSDYIWMTWVTIEVVVTVWVMLYAVRHLVMRLFGRRLWK